jgi:hypothetical protein
MAAVRETIGVDVSAVSYKKANILRDISQVAPQGVFLLLLPERMSLFRYAARHLPLPFNLRSCHGAS